MAWGWWASEGEVASGGVGASHPAVYGPAVESSIAFVQTLCSINTNISKDPLTGVLLVQSGIAETSFVGLE